MPRCKVCKIKFEARYFLQKTCENPSCLAAMAKANREASEKKAWTEKKSSLKKEVISIPKLKNEAKRVFQAWCRDRDKGLPCISCGIVDSKQWDGGHYRKAEVYSGVIFHEDNVNKQCVYCNRDLHGNEVEYRFGLIKKIGIKRVEALEELARITRFKKWSRDELFNIIKQYK